MEISIHQLLSSYCQELNESWVKHTTRIVDNQVSYESLRPFIEKFREAEQDGYDFQLVYCPFELLDKSHPGAHFEEKMVEEGSWSDITIINKMREESKTNNWLPIDAPLVRLRNEKLKLKTGSFLQGYVLENGPFFASKNSSTILVYCMMGSVGHEISLISILYSKKIEDEKSKSY
jgi:hypothetical protein